MGFGVAYHVDIRALLDHWRARVESDGTLLLRTAVRDLRADGGGWVAALEGPAAWTEVRTGAVLLATGGFQGDPELVKSLIGWDADRLPVHANPGSVGDGLRLGRAAGAALSRCLG